MTGFGEAQGQVPGETVRVEIRSVNNRHFKFLCRLPEGYASLESPIEALVRQSIHRGTVQLNLQITREVREEDYQLNERILLHYHRQLNAIRSRLQELAEVPLAAMLALPGVVTDASRKPVDLETEWPTVARVVRQGLDELEQMRTQEGQALAADLTTNCQVIQRELDQIEQRAPQIVRAYEIRLLDRINQLLSEHSVQTDPTAVIREVGIFADRTDFSEEIVRLRSHLHQFGLIMSTESSPGRKLEFLIQEMLRETNTIGSKANDAVVARHVVEIKTATERLREMIQNVE
jgi:uncharacterized protein (TIGR00255 family)